MAMPTVIYDFRNMNKTKRKIKITYTVNLMKFMIYVRGYGQKLIK